MQPKMLRTFFSFAFTLVSLLSLCACNLPQAGAEPNPAVTVTDVTISPQSGSGTFTLSMKYHRFLPQPVTISCYYQMVPGGVIMGIKTYDDDGTSAPDQERTAQFTVNPPEAGSYMATCEDETGASSMSDPFIIDANPTAPVSIQEVKVKNLAQRGWYNLEVSYIIRVAEDVSFTCAFDAPEDVITRVIMKFTEPGRIQDPPSLLSHASIFSVAGPDGSIKGGVYTATCSDDDAISSKSTTFNVEGDPIPTTTTAQTQTTIQTEGKITYEESSEQQTPHKDQYGFYPSQFHKACSPTLTIDPGGNISAVCSYQEPMTGSSPGYGTWFGGATISGTITGKAVPGGTFNFVETLTETNKPDDPTYWSTRTTVIAGTGSFVSDIQAKGTATYTAECRGGVDVASYCGISSTYDSFTGTINWEFNAALNP
jgi:hypothetical protein